MSVTAVPPVPTCNNGRVPTPVKLIFVAPILVTFVILVTAIEVAVMLLTKIFGFPVSDLAVEAIPVTFPITFPVTMPIILPMKLPTKLVAVIAPDT